MAKMKIKKGDTVEVISGKDRGARGKVLRAMPAKRKVVVEGVAVVKKAQRPTQPGQAGGFVEREAAIDVSNVMLVCPSCGARTRVGKKVNDEGKKVRFCKKCQAEI